MFTFESDYTEGAHEAILQRFLETNRVQVSGYGADPFTRSAAEKIRAACEDPRAEVVFLAGGTQTNQLLIDALLRPYEGVLCAETGHINTHESGAVESTGHKVLTLPQYEGKLKAGDLRDWMQRFLRDETREHMVWPGLVYLTWPTEYGTLYSRRELTEISDTAHEFGLKVYLDGARMAYGLVSPACDVDLPFLARTLDAFYIGGTKCGALLGEAAVFPRGGIPAHFLAQQKRHGALLAKGRAVGLQFDVLFTDGLYLDCGRHAVEQALRLKQGLIEKGYTLFLDSPTNQQFLVLDNGKLRELEQKVGVTRWGPLDEGHTIVRLVTSWATPPEAVSELLSLL